MYFKKWLFKRLFMLHGRPFFILKVAKFIYIKHNLVDCFSYKDFIENALAFLYFFKFNLQYWYVGYCILTIALLLVLATSP